MIKTISFTLAVIALSGCTWLNSVGGSYHNFDEKTVEFLGKTHPISIKQYGKQSSRPFQGEAYKGTDVLVAASGGGQRAAAFTMGVLTELENLGKYSVHAKGREGLNALKEIDYISSVSGGGWAAGAYVAEAYKHALTEPEEPYSLALAETRAKIGAKIRSLKMKFWESNCLPNKINDEMTLIGNRSLTFGDIFVGKGDKPKTPYLFVNSTIGTDHSPFVFTERYISDFQIESFKFCGKLSRKKHKSINRDTLYKSLDVNRDFDSIPLSLALSTSSSMPGFRSTIAVTSICDNGEHMKTSYLCNGVPPRNKIHLFDGGVYDNYGFRTGIEILDATPGKNKILISIDSNADTYLPIENITSDLMLLLGTAFKSSLAVNTAIARKEFIADSCVRNIKPIVLKFSDAAGFTTKKNAIFKNTGLDVTDGLEELKALVEANIPVTSTPEDREDNKYYRMGLKAVTSYKYGESYYNAIQDLGRLVVRLKTDELLDLFDPAKNSKLCKKQA